MAHLLCLNERTLQRRLEVLDRSYKGLVAEERQEVACGLLSDPGAKIIDVSFAAGYENSQHFSRAFRRTAGVSSHAHRETILGVAY